MSDVKSDGHANYDDDFLFVEFWQTTHQLNSKSRKLVDIEPLPFDTFYIENLTLLKLSFNQLIQEGVVNEW